MFGLLIAGAAPGTPATAGEEADCSAHFFFCSSFRTARYLPSHSFRKASCCSGVVSKPTFEDASRRCAANSSIAFFCSSVIPNSAATRASENARTPACWIYNERRSFNWRLSRIVKAFAFASSFALTVASFISSRIFVRSASSEVSFMRCRKGSKISRPGEPPFAASAIASC